MKIIVVGNSPPWRGGNRRLTRWSFVSKAVVCFVPRNDNCNFKMNIRLNFVVALDPESSSG
jgi:hypothetical protein